MKWLPAVFLILACTNETEIGNGGNSVTQHIRHTYELTVRDILKESLEAKNITDEEFTALTGAIEGGLPIVLVDPFKNEAGRYFHPSGGEAKVKDGRLLDVEGKPVTARIVTDRRDRDRVVIQFEEPFWAKAAAEGVSEENSLLTDLIHELVRFCFFEGLYPRNDDNYVETSRIIQGLKRFKGLHGFLDWRPVSEEGWPCGKVEETVPMATDGKRVVVLNNENEKGCVASYSLKEGRWTDHVSLDGDPLFDFVRVLKLSQDRFFVLGTKHVWEGSEPSPPIWKGVLLDFSGEKVVKKETPPLSFLKKLGFYSAFSPLLATDGNDEVYFLAPSYYFQGGAPPGWIHQATNFGAVYSLKTGRWEKMESSPKVPEEYWRFDRRPDAFLITPKPRVYPHFAFVRGELFVWGNATTDNPNYSNPYSEWVEIFSPKTRTWRRAKSDAEGYVGTPKNATEIPFVDSKLMFFDRFSGVVSYDPKREVWSKDFSGKFDPLCPPNTNYYYPDVVPSFPLDDGLAVFGKSDEKIQVLSYSPKTGDGVIEIAPTWVQQQFGKNCIVENGHGAVSTGKEVFFWSKGIKAIVKRGGVR